jgi:hypothetical protein
MILPGFETLNRFTYFKTILLASTQSSNKEASDQRTIKHRSAPAADARY